VITLQDYWMGRDALYPTAMSPQIEKGALTLLEIVNKMLVVASMAGARATINDRGTVVRSGWRPPVVNAATAKAAKNSLHMTGRAIDLEDAKGALGRWALANPSVLQQLGIWCEHPSATAEPVPWLHCQILPPRSGNRFFYP
jgi:hypothetical protein